MPLTEFQKNVAVGFGVSVAASLTVAGIIAAVEALTPEEEAARHSLSLEATAGGTTDPPPGFLKYEVSTSITVKAIAFEGYEFKGWYLNGEHAGSPETFTLTVHEQNVLIASFIEIGAPPLIPAFIRPIQNCAAEDWWKITEPGGYNAALRLAHDFINRGFVKFKICDNAGNGVPDQLLCVYSDPMPDVTDYGFLGLGIPPTVHTIENPLLLGSDSEGVVAIPATYLWMETGNYQNTIGQSGKAQCQCFPLFDWHWHFPVYDGLAAGFSCVWRNWQRLKHPIYRTLNPIHCYWQPNPNLLVYGDAYADCVVKIEESKEFPK